MTKDAEVAQSANVPMAVKPGLTGPMQVNGRGDLPFKARPALELDYIEHYPLRRDIAILLRAVPAAIRGNGAC